MTQQRFEALPQSKKVCVVTGVPITYEQYVSSSGAYMCHSSLYAAKKRKKLTVEQLKELLPSLLHSPIHGGYYETWRSLATAEASLGATPEQLHDAYDKLWYPKTACKFPGCYEHVPYEQRADGCCCTLHKNQTNRMKQGHYTADDLRYTCKLCDAKFPNRAGVGAHLKKHHKYTDADLEDYYKKYIMKPGEGVCRHCGAPTPFVSVGYGYNSFCANTACNVNWHNENTDRLKRSGEGISRAAAAGDWGPTQLGYWLKKGYDTEEAMAKLSEHQATGSVDAIMKSRNVTLEEARTIRAERTRVWMDKISTTAVIGWSKVSQELFWSVWERIKTSFPASDVYFATFDNGIKDESKNREYRIKTACSCRLPDFFIESLDKSIEFDGAFHHGPTSWRGARHDVERDAEIKQARPNHQVLHIKETEYRKNPTEVILDCIAFIFSK